MPATRSATLDAVVTTRSRPNESPEARERRLAYNRAYHQTNRDRLLERGLKRSRAWRLEHLEYARERDRRYAERNKAEIAAKNKLRYEANKEQERAKARIRSRASYESRREYMANWRAAHREELNAYHRRKHAENIETRRASLKERHHRRRARLHQVGGSDYTTIAMIRARFAYHGNRCVYCGEAGQLQADHVIPISRGGAHLPANIVPACKPCNSSKQDRKPSEWKKQEWVRSRRGR